MRKDKPLKNIVSNAAFVVGMLSASIYGDRNPVAIVLLFTGWNTILLISHKDKREEYVKPENSRIRSIRKNIASARELICDGKEKKSNQVSGQMDITSFLGG
ncbi:MAG: hypothetical protein QM697_00095 [Lachnospiraceae bacterium]